MSRVRALVVVAAVAGGCGHGAASQATSGPAPRDTAAPRKQPGQPESDGLQVSGTLGTVPQEKIEDSLGRQRAEIDACYHKAVDDQPWLGGKLAVKVKVGAQGEVKDAFLVEALGNVDVERCVLGLVRSTTFPPPEEGSQAEFTWSVEFRGSLSTEAWGNEQVGRAFSTNRAALDRCARAGVQGGVPKTLRVVLFVAPGGVVPAASCAADDAVSDPYRDCIVAEVRKWKFPDPRGKVARATYRF